MAEPSAEPASPDQSVSLPTSSITDSFQSFLNLEFGRQLGLMIGLAASVAIGVALALWLVVEKDYRPLYASLEQIDVNSIMEVLDSNSIDYRIDQNSGALLVETSNIHRARLSLASAGMPGDRNMGFELLDKDQPLGTSQFMESARYRRSLEGELARTISSIASVRSARVHLAIPKSSVFLRDKRQPRASVFIEAYQGRSVDEKRVKAVANLVASSVPELLLKNVTVVDQRGNLLSDFDQDPKYAEAARQIEYTRQIESDLLQRVNGLLAPIVGDDKFQAEISIDLDFTRVEQTAEIYNPDISAVRSEELSTEQSRMREKALGIPGSLSNQPPLTGTTQAPIDPVTGAPVESPAQSRSLEVRNYELDRTISYTQNAVGQIRRLSVAVALDDLTVRADPSADPAIDAGTESWQTQDLDRLTVLVQNAVGYDVTRGDQVIVVNTPFLREKTELAPLQSMSFWEHALFWQALRWVLGIAVFLVMVLLVLRPTLQRLTENSKKIKQLELQHQSALNAIQQSSMASGGSVDAEGNVTFNPGANYLLPSPNDSLEDQINMVKNMVAEDPDRVAEVIQGWSNNE